MGANRTYNSRGSGMHSSSYRITNRAVGPDKVTAEAGPHKCEPAQQHTYHAAPHYSRYTQTACRLETYKQTAACNIVQHDYRSAILANSQGPVRHRSAGAEKEYRQCRSATT